MNTHRKMYDFPNPGLSMKERRQDEEMSRDGMI